mmetsp:Transcript_7370/g.8568  ORF Transcript_7370/g.8568 Transcript_7370/m.8568 type:complete len:113 (+) Transcript_7370:869-1207(+)
MVRDEAISEQRNSQKSGRIDTDDDYKDRNSASKNSERDDGEHYFAGSVPLSAPDPEWLSELNCHVRDKYVDPPTQSTTHKTTNHPHHQHHPSSCQHTHLCSHCITILLLDQI